MSRLKAAAMKSKRKVTLELPRSIGLPIRAAIPDVTNSCKGLFVMVYLRGIYCNKPQTHFYCGPRNTLFCI